MDGGTNGWRDEWMDGLDGQTNFKALSLIKKGQFILFHLNEAVRLIYMLMDCSLYYSLKTPQMKCPRPLEIPRWKLLTIPPHGS